MQIEVSPMQRLNVSFSNRRSVAGVSNATDSSAMHEQKQRAPRDWTDAGTQIEANDEQEEKAPAAMDRTDAGSHIDLICRQASKAAPSLRASFESAANVTCDSFPQPSKQEGPRVSTGAGRDIEGRTEQDQKARASSTERRDPDSNVTSESRRQPSKQSLASV
jgi:hypothetical protein